MVAAVLTARWDDGTDATYFCVPTWDRELALPEDGGIRMRCSTSQDLRRLHTDWKSLWVSVAIPGRVFEAGLLPSPGFHGS